MLKCSSSRQGGLAGEEAEQGETNHQTQAEPEERDDAQSGFRSAARRHQPQRPTEAGKGLMQLKKLVSVAGLKLSLQELSWEHNIRRDVFYFNFPLISVLSHDDFFPILEKIYFISWGFF